MRETKTARTVRIVDSDSDEVRPLAHPPFLDSIVGYAVRRAQLIAFQNFDASMARHDIRPAQFSVMVMAEAFPGITQSSVAASLAIDPPRLVDLIRQLEERGLAVRIRSKQDRRAYGIFLTNQGEILLETLKVAARESDRQVTHALTEKERGTLLRILHKLY